MKIKVCGMRDAENIRRVGALPIDYMGFIFYPPSPRFAGNDALEPAALPALPPNIRKTGVFVSASPDTIAPIVEKYALDAIQLHGNETPAQCLCLKTRFPNQLIIKAFPIHSPADFLSLQAYADACHYFLFDAPTPLHGGSGQPFDWQILHSYTLPTPFFLSGGIAPQHALQIRSLRHPALHGIDLNSQFESAPALKDPATLHIFLNILRL